MAESRLEHMPVTLFTVVMGLCDLYDSRCAPARRRWGSGISRRTRGALADHGHLCRRWPWAIWPSFCAIRVLVQAEWQHPVKLAFFPAISIALVLMSIVMLAPYPGLARAMWLVAVRCAGS